LRIRSSPENLTIWADTSIKSITEVNQPLRRRATGVARGKQRRWKRTAPSSGLARRARIRHGRQRGACWRHVGCVLTCQTQCYTVVALLLRAVSYVWRHLITKRKRVRNALWQVCLSLSLQALSLHACRPFCHVNACTALGIPTAPYCLFNKCKRSLAQPAGVTPASAVAICVADRFKHPPPRIFATKCAACCVVSRQR
jgi:hypothetical protein